MTYIVIEGVMGVGKTALTRILGERRTKDGAEGKRQHPDHSSSHSYRRWPSRNQLLTTYGLPFMASLYSLPL